MPQLRSVLDGSLVQIDTGKKKKARIKPPTGVGCDFCPLDKVPGVNKIFGFDDIQGKKIMVWGGAPSAPENKLRKELVGEPGRWFWNELGELGIERDDCDVQNVVRCWPALEDEDTGRLRDRQPTPIEAKCCSIHTVKAIKLNRSKARVHIVLGQFAGKTLFGNEFKKDKRVFWSDKLNARVVVVDHPTYFIKGAPRYRLEQFRTQLAEGIRSLKNAGSGKYGYLDSQDYQLVSTGEQMRKVWKDTLAAAAAKRRTVIDIEYGWVNQKTMLPDKEGEPVMLVLGLSWKPGLARVVVLDHPEAKIDEENRKTIRKYLKRILDNPNIKHSMHHGTADVKPINYLLGMKVRGYDFDTEFSSYFKWPAQKAYGLEKTASLHFPEFAGYKDIVKPYLDKDYVNYATIPLKVMRLYNGADCDISKRLEILTKKKAGPLLRTYRDVSFVIDDMQNRGPYFDYKYYKEAASLIPIRCNRIAKKLRKIAGDPNLNLNSPPQLKKVIYEKLGFQSGVNKKDRGSKKSKEFSTDAQTLKLLEQTKLGQQTKFPSMLTEYRELSKMENNYLKNYKKSAEINNGQLRTKWWLTGTITGRLRSGGDSQNRQSNSGIVNMQNLHGDLMLKNLLISDPMWRIVTKPKTYTAKWGEEEYRRRVMNLQWFLSFDYAQVEVRVLAEMSKDPLLLKAILSGDIHSAVGHELTGIPFETIQKNKKIRTMIKALHFGIIYGKSWQSLYQDLIAQGIDTTEAETEKMHSDYFRKFKKVRQLIEYLREFAEKNGYVSTLFGFDRPIETVVEDGGRDTFWGNQAINSPIQGTAHQFMLFAMATLKQKPATYNLLTVPVMEIHDAFVFYVKTKHLQSALQQGQHLLQTAVPEYIQKNFKYTLNVPLEAEAKIGLRLGVEALYTGDKPKQLIEAWKVKNKEVEAEIAEEWGNRDAA